MAFVVVSNLSNSSALIVVNKKKIACTPEWVTWKNSYRICPTPELLYRVVGPLFREHQSKFTVQSVG